MCFNHRIKRFVSSRVYAMAQPKPALALTDGAGRGLRALTGHSAVVQLQAQVSRAGGKTMHDWR